MTAREEVEQMLGVAKTARIGRRYPAAPAWAPSHWRKTLKVWATVVLVLIGLSFVGGVVVGIIERVWP